MAKEDKKQEQGVETTPAFTENKVVEVSDIIATAETEDLTGVVLNKDVEIKGLKEIVLNKDVEIKDFKEIVSNATMSLSEFGIFMNELGFVFKDVKGMNELVENEVLIRFLLSPAGKYKLPYNVGQEVALHAEVAAEIVEAKYAEYVK